MRRCASRAVVEMAEMRKCKNATLTQQLRMADGERREAGKTWGRGARRPGTGDRQILPLIHHKSLLFCPSLAKKKKKTHCDSGTPIPFAQVLRKSSQPSSRKACRRS